MRELSGKVAVVTGAASGIGRAVAEQLAGEGMRVVLADLEEEPLRAVEDALRRAGGDVAGVRTDVSVADSVEELAGRARDRFGQVHLLHNNAGVGGGGLTWELPLPVWEWLIGVNLWGVIHGIRFFVPEMVAKGEGHVVNTASIAGLLAGPGLGAYSATKHAVVAISEALHHELALTASAVKVSVLCPGAVSTRIVDADRNWPERLGPKPEPPGDPALQAVGDMVRRQIEAGLAPAAVAEMLVEAVKADRFWILTHPEQAALVERRAATAAAGGNPELFPVL
jgi:NAD(P)-dependent dehydrogenase (short-subunit alcohol dehydrogenase family)